MLEASAAPLLMVRGLTKSYREAATEHIVLSDVRFAAQRGETIALLGRSGSGKSTLLNLIAGIETPDHGEVRIGDACITQLDERSRTLFRRRHIGFVFQFFNLIPTLTVLENVLLPLELNGRLTSSHRAWAQGLLEEVGLAGRAHAYPDRLSGGEQQRIAVVRGIVHEPLLLLADEPTGNLDEHSSAPVLELFRRLVQGSGTTLIVVTHNREVAQLADRVFTLQSGRLAPATPVVEPGNR